MCFRNAVMYWISLATVFAASSGMPQSSATQYTVAQRFVLDHQEKGTAAVLLLSMDTRLSGSLQKQLWGKGDWSIVFLPDSSVYKEFSNRPPIGSKLSILDNARKVIAERVLERPLAKLEAWKAAAASGPIFLLTQDYSTGAGSYTGLVTTLLTVSDDGFHELRALDTGSHHEEPIRLMKSLKSDWRVVQHEGRPEILSVSCHPNRNGKFVVDYARYSLDGNQWVEYKHQAAGFWESDQQFPGASAFQLFSADPQKRLEFRTIGMGEMTDKEGTKAGFRTALFSEARFGFTAFEASDGEKLTAMDGEFRSPEEAKRYFEWRVARCPKILKRGVKTDSKGKLVGYRAEVLLAPDQKESALMWTNGATYFEVSSSSLADALELEKQHRK